MVLNLAESIQVEIFGVIRKIQYVNNLGMEKPFGWYAVIC